MIVGKCARRGEEIVAEEDRGDGESGHEAVNMNCGGDGEDMQCALRGCERLNFVKRW